MIVAAILLVVIALIGAPLFTVIASGAVLASQIAEPSHARLQVIAPHLRTDKHAVLAGYVVVVFKDGEAPRPS